MFDPEKPPKKRKCLKNNRKKTTRGWPRDESFDYDNVLCRLEENVPKAALHPTKAVTGAEDLRVVARLIKPAPSDGKHQIVVPKGSNIIYETTAGHITMELSAGIKGAEKVVRTYSPTQPNGGRRRSHEQEDS